ncbi:MAG TPA: 4-hydroxy-tetrahydrodipicolinate reductase [Acidimicrobiia bacterium]
MAIDKIRVCIAGITGWVGRPLAEAIAASKDLDLVGGIARSDKRHFSSVEAALDSVSADVLVDYTSAAAVKENVLTALARGVGVVVGSSGMSASDYDEVNTQARARGVGVIAAGNFSITAALLLRFATEAARHVEAWEVIDYASLTKPDAPSGTARELAERMSAVRSPAPGVPLEQMVGLREARGASLEGTRVHSVRLPSFSVSTEAVLAAGDERLTIRHDAGASATPYIAGTMLAIRAVVGRTGLTRGLDQLLF